MYEVLGKGRLHNLSISCIVDLFDKIVKLILLYGCEIWGFSNYILLERVQLKFCNINIDLYQDVYTILNRIYLTIWTICAFRVLNPRQ